MLVIVAIVYTGDSALTHPSSSSRESRVTQHGHCSPVSSLVVMATRTCQSLLRHRRPSQLATVTR